jgi:hypothetical protein
LKTFIEESRGIENREEILNNLETDLDHNLTRFARIGMFVA